MSDKIMTADEIKEWLREQYARRAKFLGILLDRAEKGLDPLSLAELDRLIGEKSAAMAAAVKCAQNIANDLLEVEAALKAKPKKRPQPQARPRVSLEARAFEALMGKYNGGSAIRQYPMRVSRNSSLAGKLRDELDAQIADIDAELERARDRRRPLYQRRQAR